MSHNNIKHVVLAMLAVITIVACRRNNENVAVKTPKFTIEKLNGHTPVKTVKGESPIKAGGKLLVIDGGFSKAYQKETGIAGYTLIYNSYGLLLARHEPFKSVEKAVKDCVDIKSFTKLIESVDKRTKVGDTDNGQILKERIKDLKQLLQAYRSGIILERM